MVVVDDSSTVRATFRLLLGARSEFATPLTASDGREAVEVVIRERPDIVIMDVHMPVMDGLQASREILALWPEARIVINTGNDDQAVRTEATTIGIWGYVTKGDPPRNLVAQLIEHCQRDRPAPVGS